MSRRRKTGGFTLISVLLAVTMLTIGLVALARTQGPAHLGREWRVEPRGRAVARERPTWSSFAAATRATLVSEAAVAVDAEGQPAAAGPYRRSTIVTLDQANLLRLQVLVVYPRGPVPIELTTLIYRPAS